MLRNKLIVFLLLLLVLSGFYLYMNAETSKSEKDPYSISVICRDQSSESLSVIKSGIDKAADELNADISFYTLTSGNGQEQQISLLKREVENGAGAVLIMPVSSPDLLKAMKDINKKVPVIILQSASSDFSGLETVSCNNSQLGLSLADKILQSEKSASEFVLLNPGSNAELCAGLETGMKNSGVTLSRLDFSASSSDAGKSAKSILLNHRNKVLIALDSQTLEIFGKARKDLLSSGSVPEGSVYGFGRSNAIASLLEENAICAVGAENEYGIGYLGVKAAVDRINHTQSSNVSVNYVIADSSNLYSPENAYIIFPFV